MTIRNVIITEGIIKVIIIKITTKVEKLIIIVV